MSERAFNVEQAIEAISDRVHQGWMNEKLAQGFADHPYRRYTVVLSNGTMTPPTCDTCWLCRQKGDALVKTSLSGSLHLEECYPQNKHHSDMLPYAELPEHIKEYDRKTARMVFEWLAENGWQVVPQAGTQDKQED